MKKQLPYALVAVLLLAGCQQPSDVKLTPDEGESALEVRSVTVPDTNLVLEPVDTLGVLPQEQMAYRAHFLVHRVTVDAGAGRSSLAYSRVFIADTAVRWFGRTVGFNGLDVGPVVLNGDSMVRVPHRISVPRLTARDTTILRGVEYVTDLSAAYQPGTAYTWSYAASPAGFPVQSVRTPGALRVLSPLGGAVIPRDRDLLLSWQGDAGSVSIILSTYDPLMKRTRPLLELRPLMNTGKARVPAKLLESLPRLQRYYVFTFILANRSGTDITQPFAAKVLAQAADVYNSFVELR